MGSAYQALDKLGRAPKEALGQQARLEAGVSTDAIAELESSRGVETLVGARGAVSAGRDGRRRPLRKTMRGARSHGPRRFLDLDLTHRARAGVLHRHRVRAVRRRRVSCAPSAAAAATTTCCRRSAAWTSPRWASAWATWCWRSCCGSAGWCLPPSRRVDVFLAAITPGRTSPHVLALAHELRDARRPGRVRAGAPGRGEAAQAARTPAGRGWPS